MDPVPDEVSSPSIGLPYKCPILAPPFCIEFNCWCLCKFAKNAVSAKAPPEVVVGGGVSPEVEEGGDENKFLCIEYNCCGVGFGFHLFSRVSLICCKNENCCWLLA